MKFNSEVILITGSSRGLGRAFAQYLAAAGARVVVNSTGQTDQGEQVAAEIRQAGGAAIHFVGDVTNATSLINQVIDEFGQIDGVVHNAGIVRDKTLRKMSAEQWNEVVDVHLKSAFELAQAAWSHFENQGGGRLVFISSASGIYGNFGQANYASAKAGMYGLCRSIELEGAATNITCNCVAPFGATTMNSTNMSEEMKAVIKPEYIAPLIAYLSHPECSESGGLFEASAGVYKKLRWEQTKGLRLDTSKPISLADLSNNWSKVTDFSDALHPTDMRTSLQGMWDS